LIILKINKKNEENKLITNENVNTNTIEVEDKTNIINENGNDILSTNSITTNTANSIATKNENGNGIENDITPVDKDKVNPASNENKEMMAKKIEMAKKALVESTHKKN